MYDYLFKLIYSIFKSIEAGFSYQTDSTRSQETILFISLFELLNLMTIFPDSFRGNLIFAPLFLILVANYFIFLFGNRYKKIVSANATREKVYKPVVIVYMIGTIILFAVTR